MGRIAEPKTKEEIIKKTPRKKRMHSRKEKAEKPK